MKRAKTMFLKFVAWIKDNWMATIAGIGALAGAFLLVRSRGNAISSIASALRVNELTKKIAESEATVESLDSANSDHEADIERLLEGIAVSKREVMEIHQGRDLTNETDAEISDRFSNSGL